MGLLVPYHRQAAQERNYSGRPSATWGTLLTAHATPHTLGTKVEVFAATRDETNFIRLTFQESGAGATVTDMLASLYVGAAGSEVPLISNMLCGWTVPTGTNGSGIIYEFPIRIPRGTRLSMAIQALITVDEVYARVDLFAGANLQWVGAGVETLGALTATSRGTQVAQGGAGEGTFTAIGTSGRLYRYVQPMVCGNQDVGNNTSTTALDIGVGGVAIAGLTDFVFSGNSSELFQNAQAGRFVEVASGTALQARLESGASSTENWSTCIYGVY